METIIGLLFILLPIIFKAIEKKLQSSGKTEQAAKVRKFIDENVFEDEDVKSLLDEVEQEEELLFIDEAPRAVVPKPSVAVEPVLAPTVAPVQVVHSKLTSSVKPVSVDRKPAVVRKTDDKKEKIDPKKLVIYSEIMKTKF